jgi:TonB family protein
MPLNRKSSTLVLGFLLILAGEASAQSQLRASEIIEKVSSTYQNLRSFHFEARYIAEEQKDGVTTRSESKRILAKDNHGRMRIEFRHPSIEFLKLFDGATVWVYFPASKQYSEKILENPKDFTNGAIDDFMITTTVISDVHTRYAEPEYDVPLRPPVKMTSNRPSEIIEIGDQKIPALVVEIEYSLDSSQGRELRRTLWIDQQRFIVMRDLAIRKETISGKTSEMRTLINLTSAKINEALPDDLFTFEPPPDVRKVEHPSSPIKDLRNLDLLSKAMYGRPESNVDYKAGGIPGGVGTLSSQKTEPGKPVGVSPKDIDPGTAIKQVAPNYPLVAKKAGITGTVKVLVEIDEKGDVIDAVVVGGHPLLREVSLEAARKWKFRPTLVNDKPIKVQGILTFNFSLQ